MQQRKEPLNLFPIGPAHIWWPNGAPVNKIPRNGIYAISHPSNEREMKWKDPVF
jgi:hypothetical protein